MWDGLKPTGAENMSQSPPSLATTHGHRELLLGNKEVRASLVVVPTSAGLLEGDS